jgi:hypothetical protein
MWSFLICKKIKKFVTNGGFYGLIYVTGRKEVIKSGEFGFRPDL